MFSEDFSFETLAQQYGVGGGTFGEPAAELWTPAPGEDAAYQSTSPTSESSPNLAFTEPRWTSSEITDACVADRFQPTRPQELLLATSSTRATASIKSQVQAPCIPAVETVRQPGAFGQPAVEDGIPLQIGDPRNRSQQFVVEPESGRKIALVPVTSLPLTYRQLFSFPFFNAVQSTCLPSVLEGGSNIVMSAPTGAGKTVIFELALIRMLMEDSQTTKAVYLAPTKALCAEKTRDWSRRFGQLGCGVTELTGDSVHGLHIARKSRVIVTTPEKWDSLTRKWNEQQAILSTIRLMLVDEVHILNEPDRGARLEVLVTRTKLHGHRVRFIAVSATIPNLEDVASWIGRADNQPHHRAENAVMFQFGEEFRPCPLTKFVYGYPKARDEFAFQSYLNHKLHDLIESHAFGKPCLVFVATRRSTAQAAAALVDTYKRLQAEGKRTPALAPGSENLSFEDSELQALVTSGVAFHHAGLSLSDRRRVEQAFLEGRLSVLCCTTTLATGINLPAFCVIVRGTKQFDGQWSEIADIDLIQMMGRAGRPQYDREGVAVIMCEDTLQQKYRDLVSGTRDMESGLATTLVEHVNAEIGLRGRTSSTEMEGWIRQSFMWTRIQKNPTHYLSKDEGICLDSSDEVLQYLSCKTVNILESTGLVNYDKETNELTSTEYGDIMSRFFLRHATMMTLLRIEQGAGTRSILEGISEAEEFADLRLRQGEKSCLQALRVNAEIRFPPKQLNAVKDKVSLLIQATLSAVSLAQLPKSVGTEHSLFSDVRRIFQHAPRIVKAVMDIAIYRRDGNACKAALELARSVSARAWDGSPAMLRQIEHIGDKSIKALANAGLGTWATLASATPTRIEMILNRNPPFGSNVIKAAQSAPSFGLEVLQRSLPPCEQPSGMKGMDVALDISIRLENRATCMLKSKTSKLPLSACVLTLTSDHQYIDFRRMPLWRLDKVKTFTIRCTIKDTHTHVFVYAACDEVAGTSVLADLQPADMAVHSHRTKLVRAKAPNELVTALDSDNDATADAASMHQESVMANKHNTARVAEKLCKHRCKGTCRHACCQRGSRIESNGGHNAQHESRETVTVSLDKVASPFLGTTATPPATPEIHTRAVQGTLLSSINRLLNPAEVEDEDLPLSVVPSKDKRIGSEIASSVSNKRSRTQKDHRRVGEAGITHGGVTEACRHRFDTQGEDQQTASEHEANIGSQEEWVPPREASRSQRFLSAVGQPLWLHASGEQHR
nr:meiosis specific DNA helicase [Tranzscheliella williamsii]